MSPKRCGVLALLAMALLAALPVCANELKPLEAGKFSQQLRRVTLPAVLVFWSVDCNYCQEEMETLAWFAARNPLNVVTVKRDGMEAASEIREVIGRRGMRRFPAWVFAGVPEQLRHEIDATWYGELPRTYLLSHDGGREAVSGRLPPERLARWWAAQQRAREPGRR